MKPKDDDIAKAEEELIKLDPILGKVIELQRPIVYAAREDYFFSLCRSIIGQQVSVAAASAILKRFEEVTQLMPENVATLAPEQIKTIGLSRQKASYLHDLAEHFVEDPKIYNHLNKLDDDKVIEELTAIKGIGVWSAQMFLMFTLVRLDVFAADDVGLKRAIKEIYKYQETPNKEELEKIALKWKPYRTVASWHLWQSLRNTPK
jgi:DNA-3-methyladenine glycosylase II